MNVPTPRARFGRAQIAEHILARLDDDIVRKAAEHFAAAQTTQWFLVDNLPPQDMAETMFRSFPQPAQMFERKAARAQVRRRADGLLRSAGRGSAVRISGPARRRAHRPHHQAARLLADPKVYAGGISLMARDNFLNPHLDNSHDSDRSTYRVLNLPYYVSPGWDLQSGVHLELWPEGVRGAQQTIPSLFNRLVVMTTGPHSWHSVSRVLRDSPRCCVSNYYFSPQPLGGSPYFRVTTFRGRPEQPLRDLVLRMDGRLRQALRKLRLKGVVQTRHLYSQSDPDTKP